MRRLALGAVLFALLASAAPAAAAVCQSPAPVTPDPPANQVLSSFSVLRRTATPADSWPRTDLLPAGTTFNQGWFRLTGSVGGYRFFLLPGRKDTPCGSPPELFIGALGSISTVQGGASLTHVKRYGEWIAQGSSAGSLVAGLFPDGVAKVTVTYPKGRGHPGGVSYRHAVRKTARVRSNTALFELRRPPDDASSPSRQVWFSKSGRVIRRASGNP
jgi:opacity protein-like surface antigen